MISHSVISSSIHGVEIFFHLHLLFAFLTYLLIAILLRKHLKHIRYRALDTQRVPLEKFNCPKITIAIPAHNEMHCILDTVHAALSSDYPHFDVVVLNDGSNDNTLALLIDHYQLHKISPLPTSSMSDCQVKAMYQSIQDARLKVIDKVHSGKWDSLNFLFGYSDAKLICGLDADSVILPNALSKMMVKFIDAPDLIALGGAIIPSNEVMIQQGKIKRRKTKQSVFVGLQIIEYLRSFTSWRTGWSYLDGLLIIGGALTVFNKDAVIKVGGYRQGSICEDFELILTLHDYYINHQLPYHIWTIPDVICWTRVPVTRAQLKKQRIRWMWGALQSLNWHRNLAFSLKKPMIGWFSFPHIIFVETLAPVIEFIGHLCFILAVIYSLLSFPSLLLFGLLVYLITGFYSWYSLAINDYYMHSFNSIWQIVRLGMMGLIEPLGYRQRDAYWRMLAWWQWLNKKPVDWR